MKKPSYYYLHQYDRIAYTQGYEVVPRELPPTAPTILTALSHEHSWWTRPFVGMASPRKRYTFARKRELVKKRAQAIGYAPTVCTFCLVAQI